MTKMEKTKWLNNRLKGIGGSDAGVIMGVAPYKTIQQLYLEKIGESKAKDISAVKEVKYGSDAESHIRELFKLDYPDYEVTHKEFDIIYHSTKPYLFASVDGVIKNAIPQSEYEEDIVGVLEIKTSTIRNSQQHSQWKDKIPDYYYCQILHYLNVLEADFAILRALLKLEYYENPQTIIVDYEIGRPEVEKDIELLEEQEERFWECVVNKNPPDWSQLPSL
jgi:putative phage-type endonuclease